MMEKLLAVDQNSNAVDIVLLITRIGVSFLMLVHGLPKMASLLSEEPIQFPSLMGLAAELSLALAVLAEVVISIFLLVGLGTRIATVPLMITVMIAIFLIHGTDPFSKKELAVHYLLNYVMLFGAGSGKYSFDYLLHCRQSQNEPLKS